MFQTLPVKLPKTFFNKLNSLFLKCIWKAIKPRLNRKTLCRSVDQKHTVAQLYRI